MKKFPDLDILHFVLGAVAVEEGDEEAVLRHFLRYVESAQGKGRSGNQVMNMRKEFGFAYTSLGHIYRKRKQAEKAIRYYGEALRHIPEDAGIYFSLGDLYSGRREYSTAVGYHEKAIEAEPDHLEALNNLAWLYAVLQEADLHRPARAVTLASRASQLASDTHPRYLDTLAVACAASGDYEKAIRTAERAFDIARREPHWEDLSVIISAHLELFKAGRALQEPDLRRWSKDASGLNRPTVPH